MKYKNENKNMHSSGIRIGCIPGEPFVKETEIVETINEFLVENTNSYYIDMAFLYSSPLVYKEGGYKDCKLQLLNFEGELRKIKAVARKHDMRFTILN
jgi:hypothetical protein